MAKRKLSRRQSWRINKIQQERLDRAKKSDDSAETLLAGADLGPEQEGLIISHYGLQVEVETPKGEQCRCNMRQNLPQLITGDRVIWRAGNADNLGVVVALQERDSLLSRPDNYGKVKPVASNISCIVVVVSCAPMLSANLLDRYLVAAETVGITPTILLNKIDLLSSAEAAQVNEILSYYRNIGYRVMQASCKDDNGLLELQQLLANETSIFVGQSGVGKSSLVNVLLPEANMKTGAISDNSGLGQHTTTAARLFHMPAGGSLIDSPGIREFGLWHIEKNELLDGFLEFRPFIGHCKFRDCKHLEDPGCALQAAVESGQIRRQRLDNYHRILETLAEQSNF